MKISKLIFIFAIVVFCFGINLTILPTNVSASTGDGIGGGGGGLWSGDNTVVYDEPNSDGSLNAYSRLYVVNNNYSTIYSGWNYMQFAKYFIIERTDGRPIYDDNGVIEIDEIVNYKSDLYIRTGLLPYNYNGFLGSILNAKFTTGNANLVLMWSDGNVDSNLESVAVKDDDANTMGSGSYRNNGVNPGSNYYKLTQILNNDYLDYKENSCLSINFKGQGYWENGWWGGTGDYVDIATSLSSNINVDNRNWNNNLIATNVINSIYNNCIAYYSANSFNVTATNLNNLIRINNTLTSPIENTNIVPYTSGFDISINDKGKTKISIENNGENQFTDYYCFIDDELPKYNLFYANRIVSEYDSQSKITNNANGIKSQSINYGTFKDNLQFNFTNDVEEESPQSATYTLNDQTYSISSGEYLTENGDYEIVITDLVGHTRTITLSIDRTLNYSIFKHNNLISCEEARYTNENIIIQNNEPLNIYVELNNEYFSYSFNETLSIEGIYKIVIYDDYNNSVSFYITLDKSPPNVNLVGVENNGSTNENVYAVWQEENLIASIYLDDVYQGKYESENYITISGIYKIIIEDLCKNITTLNFEIDNKIDFEINTFNSGVSNDNIKIIANEDLSITLIKDNEIIDYEFGSYITENGNYNFVLQDNIGNILEFNFEIITTKKQIFEKQFLEYINILSITKDSENYEFNLEDNTLMLEQEGEYYITFFDTEKSKTYYFEIEIDTTPPTMEINGVEENGETGNDIATKNLSESPVVITASRDGLEFEFNVGDTISKCGIYEITLTDEAGNSTTYNFTKIYALNFASITLLAGLVCLAIGVFVIIARSNQTYEIIEDEDEEIDEEYE